MLYLMDLNTGKVDSVTGWAKDCERRGTKLSNVLSTVLVEVEKKEGEWSQVQ